MITIIAQNRNVALAIARATANDNEEDRYFYGDKYFITWTIGKMVEITTPRGQASYWFRSQSFPHLPRYFKLSVTTGNNADGTPKAYEASAQLDTIKKLLSKSESIIAATDPTMEGELVFRYIYAYLGCKQPFSRAIINDLTMKSVLRAVTQPQPSEKYDAWYRVARLRDEADWLIGINARRALAFAAGRGTYRIGRTSASVLKMIHDRNSEVKNTVQTSASYGTIAVKDGNGNIFSMISKEPLAVAPNREDEVTILSCTSEVKKIRPPKLYNLIQLQVDAAEQFGMTPLRTYEAARHLYDRKLISFPAAASSTVSYRRYTGCRKTLEKLLAYKNYASVAHAGVEISSGRSVGKDPMGTQGIVVTPVPAFVLDDDMSRVYHLIVKRMYQAFSKEAVVVDTRIVASCNGSLYEWTGMAYKSRGWHSLFPETVSTVSPVPTFHDGDTAEIFSVGECVRKSAAPEAYTDATLIKELLGVRGVIHSSGIAKDIVHLESADLIERDAWGRISLTERGRALYGIVKDMSIADIVSVKGTDALLRDLLKENISAAAYDRRLKKITGDLTAEILASAKLYPRMEEEIPCPKCSEGMLKTFGKIAKCDNPNCGHYIFRQFYGVTLSHDELVALARDGATPFISGFKSRNGKSFKARVMINASGNMQVVSKNKSENA